MPVILPPAEHEAWLDPNGQAVERLQSLLRPYPSEERDASPVNTRINNRAFDSSECTQPIAQRRYSHHRAPTLTLLRSRRRQDIEPSKGWPGLSWESSRWRLGKTAVARRRESSQAWNVGCCSCQCFWSPGALPASGCGRFSPTLLATPPRRPRWP